MQKARVTQRARVKQGPTRIYVYADGMVLIHTTYEDISDAEQFLSGIGSGIMPESLVVESEERRILEYCYTPVVSAPQEITGDVMVRQASGDGSLVTLVSGKVIPGARQDWLTIRTENGQTVLVHANNRNNTYTLSGTPGELRVSSQGRKGSVRASYLTEGLTLSPQIHLTLTRTRDNHYKAKAALVLWIHNSTDLRAQGASVDMVAGRFPRMNHRRRFMEESLARISSRPDTPKIVPGSLERISYFGVTIRGGKHAVHLTDASLGLEWILVVDVRAGSGPGSIFIRIHSSNADLPASGIIALEDGVRVGQGRMTQTLTESTGEEWIAIGQDDMVRVSNDTSVDHKTNRTQHSVTITNMRKRTVRLLVHRYLGVGDSYGRGTRGKKVDVSQMTPSFPGRSWGNTAIIWNLSLGPGEKETVKLSVVHHTK